MILRNSTSFCPHCCPSYSNCLPADQFISVVNAASSAVGSGVTGQWSRQTG